MSRGSSWPRSAAGLAVPATATYQGISADGRACSWFNPGVGRQCDGQLPSVSSQPLPGHRNREAAASPHGTASPSGAAANPSCGMSRRMTGSPADHRVVVRSRGYDILLNAGVAVRMVDAGKMRIEAAEAVGVDRHFMGGWVAAVERSGEAALAGGRPGRRPDEQNTRPSTILMSSCTTTSSRRWLGDVSPNTGRRSIWPALLYARSTERPS